MTLKEILKGAVEGTGDVAKSLMDTSADLVKEGSHDIGEIFGAVIDLGKEGVIDVTTGVKDVYVGAVNALKDSGHSTEEAVEKVTTKAEEAVGNIGEEGLESVGEAAKKGIHEAKEIVKEPFAKE